MSSFDELAQEYANRLAATPYAQAESQHIEREIRGLVYASSQSPLTREHKQEIVQKTYDILVQKPTSKKSLDNEHYLQLLQWILNQAG